MKNCLCGMCESEHNLFIFAYEIGMTGWAIGE